MSVVGIKDNFNTEQVVDTINLGMDNTVNSQGLENAINSATELLDLDDLTTNRVDHNNYNSFTEKFDNSEFPFIDGKDGYRFQGFTITDNFIYVTAYSKNDNPSVVLVYDKDGKYLGHIKLPSNGGRDSHVGGISYDGENNLLYITGKGGRVLVIDNEDLENGFIDQARRAGEPFEIDFDDLENFDFNSFVIDDKSINIRKDFKKYLKDNNIDIYEVDDSDIEDYIESIFGIEDKTNLNAASVYYDEENHKLYIPTFSGDSKVFVYDVSFDENGKPSYKLDTIYGIGSVNNNTIDDVNLPYGLQGVATYTDKNGDKYLIMASSYGFIDSTLTMYKINDDGTIEFAGQKVFKGKRGLENIVVDSDTGDIYCNFENNVIGSKNDGSELLKVNIDDIDGSNTDPAYLRVMEWMRRAGKRYDK